jgi:hypothetical protein
VECEGARAAIDTTMAARQPVLRPQRSVASATRSSHGLSRSSRAFSVSALRHKEVVSGSTSELPNLRHAQRAPQERLTVPIVNPAGKLHHTEMRRASLTEATRPVPRQNNPSAPVRSISTLMSPEIHPAVRTTRIPLKVTPSIDQDNQIFRLEG